MNTVVDVIINQGATHICCTYIARRKICIRNRFGIQLKLNVYRVISWLDILSVKLNVTVDGSLKRGGGCEVGGEGVGVGGQTSCGSVGQF
jgi:hypothetical protein